MRTYAVVAVLAGIALAGCAGQRGDVVTGGPVAVERVTGRWAVREPAVVSAAAERPARPVTPAARRPLPPGPPFRTPEAAMEYLAAAYDAGDLRALWKVTTPHAREHLLAMRETAPGLRLTGCEADGDTGTYTCEFEHGYPDGSDGGTAVLTVAPARRHGWYATVLAECG